MATNDDILKQAWGLNSGQFGNDYGKFMNAVKSGTLKLPGYNANYGSTYNPNNPTATTQVKIQPVTPTVSTIPNGPAPAANMSDAERTALGNFLGGITKRARVVNNGNIQAPTQYALPDASNFTPEYTNNNIQELVNSYTKLLQPSYQQAQEQIKNQLANVGALRGSPLSYGLGTLATNQQNLIGQYGTGLLSDALAAQLEDRRTSEKRAYEDPYKQAELLGTYGGQSTLAKQQLDNQTAQQKINEELQRAQLTGYLGNTPTMAGQQFESGQKEASTLDSLAQSMGFKDAATMQYALSLGDSMDVLAEKGLRVPTAGNPYTGKTLSEEELISRTGRNARGEIVSQPRSTSGTTASNLASRPFVYGQGLTDVQKEIYRLAGYEIR